MDATLYTFIRLSGHSTEDAIDKEIIEVHEDCDEFRLIIFGVTTARLKHSSVEHDDIIKTIRCADTVDDLKKLFSTHDRGNESITILPLTFEMLDKTPLEILKIIAGFIIKKREKPKRYRRR